MKAAPGWLWSPSRPEAPWRLCSDWRVTHGPAPWLALELLPDEHAGLQVHKSASVPPEQLCAYEQLGPLVCRYPGPTGGISGCRLLLQRPALLRYATLPAAHGAPINTCIARLATWLCQAFALPPKELRLLQDMLPGRRLRQVLLQHGAEGFYKPAWRELASGQDLALLAPSVRETVP